MPVTWAYDKIVLPSKQQNQSFYSKISTEKRPTLKRGKPLFNLTQLYYSAYIKGDGPVCAVVAVIFTRRCKPNMVE